MSCERAHPLLLCLFSDRMQNILQRIGGGSVSRLDRVRVYLTGGRCVCMTEPLCDGLQIGSGRNQQGGVCVPLRYNKDKRKNPVFSRVSAFVVAYSIPFPTLLVNEKSVE